MIVTAESLGAFAKEVEVNMPQEDIANEVAVEDTEDPPLGEINLSSSFEHIRLGDPKLFHFVLASLGVILSGLWIVFSKYESTVPDNMCTIHSANNCSIPVIDHGMMSGDISVYPSFDLDLLVFFMTFIRWVYFGLALWLMLELHTGRKAYLKVWAFLMFIALATVLLALLMQPLFVVLSKDWIFCLILLQVYMTYLWVVMLFLIREMGEVLIRHFSIV